MTQGSCFLMEHVQLLVFEMLSESLIFKIFCISYLLRDVAIWKGLATHQVYNFCLMLGEVFPLRKYHTHELTEQVLASQTVSFINKTPSKMPLWLASATRVAFRRGMDKICPSPKVLFGT